MNSYNNNKLTVQNLSKTFLEKKLLVINDVSLYVKKGEFVSLIGPSGCGKSTLLDCIAGLVTPDKGEIIINERPSYMFQDDDMLPWRNVLDNVTLPLEISGTNKKKAREEALKLLKKFDLDTFTNFYPYQLSGGMKERVSLLRTYLCDKELMLLDEPFSKLDALTRLHMQQWLLKMLRTKQHTVLFVTHDVDEAILLSDRIYVVSQRPCTVLSEIKIPLSKPRQSTMLTRDKFVSIKKEIMQTLAKAY